MLAQFYQNSIKIAQIPQSHRALLDDYLPIILRHPCKIMSLSKKDMGTKFRYASFDPEYE